MLESVYQLLDVLMPFQWMHHIFMKNAFLAVLLITPLFGILGTMVVSNKMAFFSDSLGHGAFTGVALGVLLGTGEPVLSIIAFSIVFAGMITYIKYKSKASADTVIGVFSSTAIALGLMLMSYGGSFAKFSAYLIGDLLSISSDDLSALLMVFILVFVVWYFIYNKLLLVSINVAWAASRGIKALWIEMVFAGLLAVIVAISIQWVGLLIINSLLVLPAAAARNVTNNVKTYHLVSVMFALTAGIAGLISSYYCNTTTGATIVMISAGLFFLTLAFKPYFQK